MQRKDDGNRHIVVYLATRLWAEDRRIVVRFSEDARSSPKTRAGAHPTSYSVIKGKPVPFQEIKVPRFRDNGTGCW